MQLSGIDLNLLVVLDALLHTRSVKEAAARVALSPSATSHALGRLRELFGDPLLIRAGRRLVLSARAEALQPAVRAALDAVGGVFSEEAPADPAALQRRFTVVTTDYVELALMQPLGAELAVVAPGVDLYSRRAQGAVVDELRRGTADLAVGVHAAVPPDVSRVPLFRERFVCLVRDDHPVLAEGLTLDAYCALRHVLISPKADGRGVVDAKLEALGRSRRVARTVASFLAAPHMILGTDFVLTVASRLAERIAPFLGLAILEPPLELPGFAVSLLWHQRAERDGGSVWLRGRVEAHARGLGG